MTEPHTTTIEQERHADLKEYQESLIENTRPKEELLPEDIIHDVAISEAEAGKIKLPTMIPIKTIRLDIHGFNAFAKRKFYKLKFDYDLYFEVNADNPIEAKAKARDFINAKLKGMVDAEPESVEEFTPQYSGLARFEKEEYF